MKKSRIVWAVIGVILLLVLGGGFYVASIFMDEPDADTPAPVFEHDKLSIRRADGEVLPFDVELATTPKQSAYGLMFRHSIEPQTGMLFIWDIDHEVSMWMKNTYIPLDMLFIGRDGVIVKIITHAVPLNLTPLSSDEPVHAVMEIKAGEADRLNIQAGDKLLFWAFSTAL